MDSPKPLPDVRPNPRLHGVDPTSRRDVWVKKLLYPAHTVPTAAAPVLVGIGFALGDGVFRLIPALAVFLFGWLVQIGGVLADNYFNLLRYRDDAEHPALVSALDQGVVTLTEIRDAIVVSFLLAATTGLYLLRLGGVPVFLVGLGSVLASLLYSAEITEVPLHDLYFFFFFGPVSVGGTYYVQAVSVTSSGFPLGIPPGTLPLVVVFAGVPIGVLTTNILVVDNVRDIDFDQEKSDSTLAVVIGERWSRYQYRVLLAVAYLCPVVLWASFGRGSSILLPLVTLPIAVWVLRAFTRARSYVELHAMSPRTGQVLLVYAVLLGVGAAIPLGSA